MYQRESKCLRLVALLLESTGILAGLSATFLFPTLSRNFQNAVGTPLEREAAKWMHRTLT